MEYICEEADESYLDDDIPLFTTVRDNSSWYYEGEAPVQDTTTATSRCPEHEQRKSDLQLADRLEELADSLRTGITPKFLCERPTSPGQYLQELLNHVEKRILDKAKKSPPRARFPAHYREDQECLEAEQLEPACATTSTTSSARKKQPLPKRLRFTESPQKREVTRSRPPAIQPPSPDWTMLNDSDEIICQASDRTMYGMTAGDVWRRRAEQRGAEERGTEQRGRATAPSPSTVKSRSPIRQVSAVPIRCLSSTKFDDEDDYQAPPDLNLAEHCGCLDEVFRRPPLRSRASPIFSEQSPRRTPRPADKDSIVWCSPRKFFGDDDRSREYPLPSGKDSIVWCSARRIFGDDDGKECSKKKGRSHSKSPSCSNSCCCDELAQKVADWTQFEFGPHSDKNVGTGLLERCGNADMKPILKKKPIIGKKTCGDPAYKSFLSGLPSQIKSSPKTFRKMMECQEYIPEAVACIREHDRSQRSPEISRRHLVSPIRKPHRRYVGLKRNNSPVKIRLVSPPRAFYEIDELSHDDC